MSPEKGGHRRASSVCLHSCCVLSCRCCCWAKRKEKKNGGAERTGSWWGLMGSGGGDQGRRRTGGRRKQGSWGRKGKKNHVKKGRGTASVNLVHFGKNAVLIPKIYLLYNFFFIIIKIHNHTIIYTPLIKYSSHKLFTIFHSKLKCH